MLYVRSNTTNTMWLSTIYFQNADRYTCMFFPGFIAKEDVAQGIFSMVYFPQHVSLPPATELGQGYVFTGVCHSINRRGGGVPDTPQTWNRHHPGPGTPPWEQTPPPQSRHPSSPGADTPGTRYTPQDQVHPHAEHAGRYGQWAGGTHPTGMQSCLFKVLFT